MVMDRIHRHDVLNALMLALALLMLGFGVVKGISTLSATLDEGVVDSVKVESAETGGLAVASGDQRTAEVDPELLHPPGEVSILVGNGSGKRGAAGSGSSALSSLGYHTLPPDNAKTAELTTVYWVDGFEADGLQVGALVGVTPSQVQPLPAGAATALEMELTDAEVIVILGADSGF